MKKRGIREKPQLKKKNTRFRQVTSCLVGSTGFGRVVAPAGLLTNPDRSIPRVVSKKTEKPIKPRKPEKNNRKTELWKKLD